MSSNQLPFELPGFQIEAIQGQAKQLIVQAQPTGASSECPYCGMVSSRVHSYYKRSLRDLPSSGQSIRLQLRVRRFRCLNPDCGHVTFAERIPQVGPWHGQRTPRLTEALRAIAFELGGEAGIRVLRHLGMAWSGDTLLRLVRTTDLPFYPTPRVLGARS